MIILPVITVDHEFIYAQRVIFLNKVNDFTADIDDAGEEYNEIEVNPNKRTELFEVPAQPGALSI